MRRALKAASLDWAAIDQVLLAGGSTLVPAVEAAVRRASDKPGDRVKRHQPHMAIAYGAALIAAQRRVLPRARPRRYCSAFRDSTWAAASSTRSPASRPSTP